MFGAGRRRRLKGESLPDAWRGIIERNVPAWAGLTDEQRARLGGLVNVFLDDKTFEGAGGLEITDEIRVTIAAQACLLLIGRDPERPYPGLRSVIVYPHAYVGTGKAVGPGGVVTESEDVRLGESWSGVLGSAGGGPVVVAWDEVRRGGCDPHDGRNVVYHEFAHQLDGQATGMDGAPALGSSPRYTAWARVLGSEFESLRETLEAGGASDIRAYGATNPAEFFAVITEAYFERPERLRARHPALFEQLRAFYGWAPAGA